PSFPHPSSPITLLKNAPQMPVSSTEIRHLLRSLVPDAASPSLPLPPSVLSYIRTHSLYTAQS
ncbi:MAG: hypothetical protein K2M83_09005, partial [Muribaculaceae bacterium]|nr:hypothetical protein [Muribaculaceae bacterium]